MAEQNAKNVDELLDILQESMSEEDEVNKEELYIDEELINSIKKEFEENDIEYNFNEKLEGLLSDVHKAATSFVETPPMFVQVTEEGSDMVRACVDSLKHDFEKAKNKKSNTLKALDSVCDRITSGEIEELTGDNFIQALEEEIGRPLSVSDIEHSMELFDSLREIIQKAPEMMKAGLSMTNMMQRMRYEGIGKAIEKLDKHIVPESHSKGMFMDMVKLQALIAIWRELGSFAGSTVSEHYSDVNLEDFNDVGSLMLTRILEITDFKATSVLQTRRGRSLMLQIKKDDTEQVEWFKNLEKELNQLVEEEGPQAAQQRMDEMLHGDMGDETYTIIIDTPGVQTTLHYIVFPVDEEVMKEHEGDVAEAKVLKKVLVSPVDKIEVEVEDESGLNQAADSITGNLQAQYMEQERFNKYLSDLL